MVTTAKQAAKAVAAYDYVDPHERLRYQVVRLEHEDGRKEFRQRRPLSGGRWAWNLEGVERVLYRLPRVLEAVRRGERVWIVEGEKDVEALEALGLTATCNPGGAGKWRPEYAEALRDARVVIVVDRDEPGRAHAAQIIAALREVAMSIVTVEAAEGKDAADHLAAGHKPAEFVPVRIDPAKPEPKPRRSSRRSPPNDDVTEALRAIPAAEYFEKLTGQEVRTRGRYAGKVLCPFHEERTPSCQAGLRGSPDAETKFYCYGCGAGGDIFTLASAHWGIEARGEGFKELRSLLAAALLGRQA